MQPPLIPQDKANHVVYGAGAAAGALIFMVTVLLVAALLGFHSGIQRWHLAAAAMAVTTVAAWWKEWRHDAARPATNTVDKRDFWATVGGGLLVCAPVFFTHLHT